MLVLYYNLGTVSLYFVDCFAIYVYICYYLLFIFYSDIYITYLYVRLEHDAQISDKHYKHTLVAALPMQF